MSSHALIDEIIDIELTNSNTGRGHHWGMSATRRKKYELYLRHAGLDTIKTLEEPVVVEVTRYLGPRQSKWDSSSGLRGNYKEIEDALVAVGWFHDDGYKWIVETRFLQNASNRQSYGRKTRIRALGVLSSDDLQ